MNESVEAKNKNFFKALTDWLTDLFNLRDADKAHERDTKEDITKGIIFRGANLWILIFAILVCSVGLNVNSTAVIIGAMLISPIMGPIMGIGLGMGINDFQLIVKALKNLGIAVLMSVLASALYFWLSPLNEAQSELLARTSPNFWDVLIAFFGGTAGIVASSRKEKSNAVPGVAIATALMPPLCTAGYGLANLNWDFFFGALYLFCINSVFISLSTYMIVRVLKYRKKVFEKPEREARVKRYIAIIAIATIIPSIITAFNVVSKTVFTQNCESFINSTIKPTGCKVITKTVSYHAEGSELELTLYGDRLEEDQLAIIQSNFEKKFGKENKIKINQGADYVGDDDLALLKEYVEKTGKTTKKAISKKDSTILSLENEILHLKSNDFEVNDFALEAKSIFTNLTEFSLSDNVIIGTTDSMKMDTVVLVYTKFKKKPLRAEREKLTNWLKVKTKKEKVKLIVE